MYLPATFRVALGISLLAMLPACTSVSAAGVESPRSIEDGQEFPMQVGEQIALADRATLHYLGVSNDSRCQPDVQCIWAGDAEVRFEWSTAGTSKTFTLHTGKDPRRQALGDRTLILVSLARGEAPEAHLRVDSTR
jgi:hypothetical protein